MADRPQIRADFARMMERPDQALDLGHAALLIAAETDPGCDVEAGRRQLDDWGATLAARLEPRWNNLQKLARLRDFVFEELKFRGDRKNYYAPENALLSRVLDRRLGIPLTLGIVFMEVGWRVGVPLEGVGFPGHFLVRLTGEPGDLVLDPFSHAQSVHEEDCQRMIREITGGRMRFRPDMLAAATKRDMIARLLLNLKGAYLRIDDDFGALAAVERVLLLNPEDSHEIRDHGLLLDRVGRPRDALLELQHYLEVSPPDAADRPVVERHVMRLQAYLSSLN